MSRSRKHTPAGPEARDKPITHRLLKRLHHKRERARVRLALCAGFDADFCCTPSRTYLIGDGNIYHRHAPADLRQ